MKVFVLLVILLGQFGIASANDDFGTIEDSRVYKATSETKGLDGQLQLLLFHTSKANNNLIYSAPKYEVFINDLKVATIAQSFSAISFQQGEFSYLKLNLPTGKYSGELRQSSLLNSGVKKRFSFIIQQGMSLPVIYENLQPSSFSGVPASFGGSLILKADAEIDESNYRLLINSMSRQAEEFNVSVQINREEAARNREANALRAARIAEERNREREERARQAEVEREQAKRADEERKRAQLAEKEQQAKLERERISKEDDSTCVSFGAKFGTEPYVACRIALAKARQEQIDRENNNRLMRENIEEARRQATNQQRQRDYEAQQAEERRQAEIAAQQQRLAEEQRRRERAERLDSAQRAFEAAARLSQPTPGVPINMFPQIQSPQRATCFRNGNFIDCRTQ